MPRHLGTRTRRTGLLVLADRRADELARTLGRALREARRQHERSQADVAALAGLAQSTVSRVEAGGVPSLGLRTWIRLSRAAGSDLHVYLERAAVADRPRDAVHLRGQERILRAAASGGWQGMPEERLDPGVGGSRSADLVLRRPLEIALVEVWDWLDDVGAAFRSWDGKLHRLEARAAARDRSDDLAVARVSGFWVVRATRRNRQLVADHAAVFAARFPARVADWLAALATSDGAMPDLPGLVWLSVDGARLA